MNPTTLSIVFSGLNGGLGVWLGFFGAWFWVILILTVMAVPYLIVVFSLYRASGYISDEWSPLALAPLVNAAVLTRRVRGSWDGTGGALFLLTPPFCLTVHLAVFSWILIGNDYGGSILSAWLDANFDLLRLLFLAETHHLTDTGEVHAAVAFLAGVPTVFAHWFAFGWWPWLEITRDLQAPSRLRRLGAIPVIGLTTQWTVASRAKDPRPFAPDARA